MTESSFHGILLAISLIAVLLVASIPSVTGSSGEDVKESPIEDLSSMNHSEDLPFVLVTGGNGLVASNLISELLQRGHHVRATVRDPFKASHLRTFSKAETHLEIAAFDLKEQDKQVYKDLLMGGIDWIFHVAAPFVDFLPQSDETIKIAVQSITWLLQAAQESNASQVVYTGSGAAVYFGYSDNPIKSDPNYIFTEDDWTNVTSMGILTDYAKMKTLTELAAWEFVEKHAPNFRFSSLLPGFVLGTLLSETVTSSKRVIFETMMGTYPGVFDLYIPLVDIRDVVEAHFRAAMQKEESTDSRWANQRRRFLLTRKKGKDIFYPKVAAILKEHFGPMGYSISTWHIPNWVLRIASLFDRELSVMYQMLGVGEQIDNSKSIEVLGLTYHSNAAEMILNTAHTMIQQGLIPKKVGYHARSLFGSGEL
ncbi:Bifunctional dihydroflavonol 4-reductase/flavanone 4-reductase [Seminavis robusta]|uniref:Bifunctional dihydroflavonol 4-reductase/flavanone 4-reductase n=1 Tax=Seminavis robusta TaxID=568900 RepID=A0A9N8EKE3_9STRA|nr:Bifunctional dihydroflavonol 4-reductase/flavanone 4-reductase [Seminavis robusta]|eukprot:Sro1127_g244210.1 Bifunctional dihydroflavonol 4-reductase/flavanone 4-reductase (424) ;mRNA; f:22633-23904